MLKLIFKVVAILATCLLLALVFAGYFLGDNRIAPFFGFRTEMVSSYIKTIPISTTHHLFDSVTLEIAEGNTEDFSFFRVRLKGKTIFESGGSYDTYYALKDIDGDGIEEVIVASPGPYTEQEVGEVPGAKLVKVSTNARDEQLMDLRSFSRRHSDDGQQKVGEDPGAKLGKVPANARDEHLMDLRSFSRRHFNHGQQEVWKYQDAKFVKVPANAKAKQVMSRGIFLLRYSWPLAILLVFTIIMSLGLFIVVHYASRPARLPPIIGSTASK